MVWGSCFPAGLVFLTVPLFREQGQYRVSSCDWCCLVSNFCPSSFKEKRHPFSLTNSKREREREKDLSTNNSKKHRMIEALEGSVGRGAQKRRGLPLKTAEPHECAIRGDCVILNSPGFTWGASISWLNRLSGLKLASHPKTQDGVRGGWQQPWVSFEASTASEFSLIKRNPTKHWVGKTRLTMQPVSAQECIQNRLGQPPVQSETNPESCRHQEERTVLVAPHLCCRQSPEC